MEAMYVPMPYVYLCVGLMILFVFIIMYLLDSIDKLNASRDNILQENIQLAQKLHNIEVIKKAGEEYYQRKN